MRDNNTVYEQTGTGPKVRVQLVAALEVGDIYIIGAGPVGYRLVKQSNKGNK